MTFLPARCSAWADDLVARGDAGARAITNKDGIRFRDRRQGLAGHAGLRLSGIAESSKPAVSNQAKRKAVKHRIRHFAVAGHARRVVTMATRRPAMRLKETGLAHIGAPDNGQGNGIAHKLK